LWDSKPPAELVEQELLLPEMSLPEVLLDQPQAP
jgi:hypothetical protein